MAMNGYRQKWKQNRAVAIRNSDSLFRLWRADVTQARDDCRKTQHNNNENDWNREKMQQYA